MVHWAGDRLKALGASIEYVDVGMQTMHDGSTVGKYFYLSLLVLRELKPFSTF